MECRTLDTQIVIRRPDFSAHSYPEERIPLISLLISSFMPDITCYWISSESRGRKLAD